MGIPMNMNLEPPCPSNHGMPQRVTTIPLPPLESFAALGFINIYNRADIRWEITPYAQKILPSALISQLTVHPDFLDIGELREISALDLGTALWRLPLSRMPEQLEWFKSVQSTCWRTLSAIYGPMMS
ncbi:hypothetical protein CPSG_05299 [Coccidioides posadasii str. Silveira]|uniref:Uncharacterized protein n=1 Tax=Coccidioides posadasii (strain RMSCC 757 / Silveira) TaxID=443226 RepID=E9D531_COCPS|nr:hypothetical protein CPSG_05299 [Coccidioides posadasii str. Silveira]